MPVAKAHRLAGFVKHGWNHDRHISIFRVLEAPAQGSCIRTKQAIYSDIYTPSRRGEQGFRVGTVEIWKSWYRCSRPDANDSKTKSEPGSYNQLVRVLQFLTIVPKHSQ